MITDLSALLDAVTGGERAARRRLIVQVAATVASDFALISSLIAGLRQRRMGEAPGATVLLFLLALTLFGWLTWSTRRTANRYAAAASRARVTRITRRLPQLPLLELQALGRGKVVTRLLGDANRLTTSGQAVVGLLSGAMRLCLGSAFAWSLSAEAAVVALVGLFLMGLTVAGQMAIFRSGLGQVAEDEARAYEVLDGHAPGAASIALHRPRADGLGRAVDRISERIRQVRVRIFTAFYERQYAGDSLVYGLLGVNVFFLPLFIDISAEGVRELNIVVLWLVFGAVQLTLGLPRVSTSALALGRLDSLVARLEDSRLEPASTPADAGGGRFAGFSQITLRQVDFAYPDTEGRPGFEIGPLDLSLRRGELVFVTGANGSGKSTFARLLAGLYRPASGAIEADGVAVDDGNLGAWRGLFSTVFVEHTLFDRVPGWNAAAAARAPELLAEMDLAEKTAIVDGRITERSLSTGQKKRLALVLARLADRPIIILDEWAADQDPEYRALFYDALLPAVRAHDRLVVVVTHDDQYFDRADRGIVFEGGRIARVTP